MQNNYTLTVENIPNILQDMKNYMMQGKMKDADITAILSSFEAAMNKWLEKFNGQECILYLEKKFKTYDIELVIPKTEAFDPYEDETHDADPYYSEAYQNLSDSYAYVTYDYEQNNNRLTFSFRKNSNSNIPMLISFGAAIILGLILKFALPKVGSVLATNFFDPLCSKFISMLTMVASPMMFFLLVTTICELGTRRELSNLGKRLIKGILFTLIALMLCTFALTAIVYGVNAAEAITGEAGTSQFAAIRDLILNIIPGDVISPFSNGNALQIVFLALLIGVIVFIKKSQKETIIKFNTEVSDVFQTIMVGINNIMPVYIFFSLTSLIISVDFSEFKNLWKLFALFFAMILIYYVILILRIALVAKRNPLEIIKDVMPPFLTALMTASSLAAFNKSMKCSTEKFGLPKQQAKFYMSTGRTIYKPASTANYFLIACFFAYMSTTINMSISWYVMAFITCLILGIATPPIPGGAKTCYTILFLQLGIPTSWLALVIAVDTIFDFFCTSADVAGLQVQLLCINEKNKRKMVK